MSYEIEDARRYELKAAELNQALRSERRNLAIHQRDVLIAKDRYQRCEDSFNSVLSRLREDANASSDPRQRIASAQDNQARLIAQKRKLTSEQEVLVLLEARQSAIAKSIAKKERSADLVDSLAHKITQAKARRLQSEEAESVIELSTAARADKLDALRAERLAAARSEARIDELSREEEASSSDGVAAHQSAEPSSAALDMPSALAMDSSNLSLASGSTGDQGQGTRQSDDSGRGSSQSSDSAGGDSEIPWDRIREFTSSQQGDRDSLAFTYTTESGEEVQVSLASTGDSALSVELLPGSSKLTRLLRGDQERIRGLLEEQGYSVQTLAVRTHSMRTIAA